MLHWVKRQLEELGSPTLDWVQVEVTTDCNASCVYCPRTLMRQDWTNRHMRIELFLSLVPFLKHAELVYLQGWGEPLLHDSLFEMVRICKDLGKRVGFTTNGMFLSEDVVQRLMELQVDIVAVSLAGATANTHNQIRRGNDFEKIISHLERLRNIKAEKKARKPSVHLAYLMLKSNFNELKAILSLAKRVGASQVIASNLTLILDSRLSGETIFHDIGRIDYYRNSFLEISQKAAQEDIVFDYHGPDIDEASFCCRENVCRACVINIEGEVVPCVFTNPVLSSQYIFKDQSYPIRDISFGNIGKESLTRIWSRKEYVRFRGLSNPGAWEKLEKHGSAMPECCMRCYKRLGA